MGVSLLYRAMPTSSELFRRMRSDPAIATLAACLFPHGSGLFHFFKQLDREEREEILDHMIESRAAVLGPRHAARKLINEFQALLGQARLDHPGVERRSCSLEKTHRVIQQRLTQVLEPLRSDAKEFARQLLFGDQTLFIGEAELDLEDQLMVISPELVSSGWNELNSLEVEMTNAFINHRMDEHEDFKRWRQTLGEAAAHGEALLMGVA